MNWDHLAEESSQKLFASWLQLLSPAVPLTLAGQHRPGHQAIKASSFTTGAFNICCTVTFEDEFRVVVRFPILGRSRFRTEKTRDEVSVMNFLSRRTRVPVPIVLGAGRWGCGPYVVTTFIEGTLLSKQLKCPSVGLSDLERAYQGMAEVMLELSKPTFPSIGALEFESGKWQVTKRPMTLSMNELVRVGNLPPAIFTRKIFPTAAEYFEELATQQLLHVQYQRNDAVENEHDARKKYIARCLFRKIARDIQWEPGPFHLWCDDFCPSNVLVSESDLTITGVIDWEFTYVAPTEFTCTAPWWLLFERPEAWGSDLNDFLARYTPRLQFFLKILRACEDRQVRNGTLTDSQRLSDRMARSLDCGLFWFCLATRRSFMFDDIYWTFLDEKHFGRLNSLDDRLSLLSQDELDGLDGFVRMKMQQVEEKRLDEHLTFDELVDL
ncbi:phosphotransferase enzyme family protein [Histoplasma capsulatum G186AR]|uniref:Phosphotransferase enzyme family protein n=2 Tax=Ajellomyces capsulatus TaxID=5037 RepID=C0NX27_AJECG|nr:phosphotransferase enzyme family protein [Histoplasma capsulatum G186AR]EEH03893.1 phosphotransferase enzyme family protein [Histoplasma capsulatum G186AR]KAG5295501.1 phosphotransferase enzyme family protein [Histoplasma capsulatum]QSS73482.1 phosphotransferase enzyme family protein [Histoplasma capsulatum G186AR]